MFKPVGKYFILSSSKVEMIGSTFKISHWRFPECSLKDKILHFFFVISVLLMIACAAVTIICFKEVDDIARIKIVFAQFNQ